MTVVGSRTTNPDETVNTGRPDRGRILISPLFDDLIDSRSHSSDFNGSRADYIMLRIRVIALTLAVITPTWIPVDFMLLPAKKAVSMTIMRIVATVLFLVIAFWSNRRYDLTLARIKLVALIGILGVCHIISQLTINGENLDDLLAAYSFLPYLLIAVQAIFPLTLVESLGMIVMVMGMVAGQEWFSGRLMTLGVLSELWLMGLLAGIVIWAQMIQLHMLLSLYRQATLDPLTSLYNRRAFLERMDDEISRARRYQHPITLLMFDLDRFKRVNDSYGHLIGDYLLQHFAKLLSGSLRTTDLVGRYGGEEFLALLPETDEGGGMRLAERIRRDCEGSALEGPKHESITFTVSGGVAQINEDENATMLIKRVDDSLYEAKKQGRNQIVLAE